MSRQKICVLVVLALATLIGIVSVQVYWVRQAYELKDRQFAQMVTRALTGVGRRIAKAEPGVPVGVQVVPLSSAYFLVNLDAPIDEKKLNYFLRAELEMNQILIDFEYGLYDKRIGQVVYANQSASSVELAAPIRLANSPYYFVVRFPTQARYLAQQLNNWSLASAVVLLIIVFFGYLLYSVLNQKQHAELQRDFINNMTHEFQTPIAAIKLATDVLASPKVIDQPERMLKYVRMVQEETQRLQQQVETVLTIARAEKRTFVLNPEVVDVHELAHSLAERHGTYLSLDLRAQFPMVRADRLHLINVLSNLLDNAVKYSPVDPHIQIISYNENKDLTIAIKDNGIGIAPEHQSRVFQSFFRAPGVNAHNVKGFGLGLNYVQKIVKAHRWKLDLESTLGQGSLFIIRIPQSPDGPVQGRRSSRQQEQPLLG